MYSCQRTVRRLLFNSFCLEADRDLTILATPVAAVTSALYSGHDHLVGHSLAVLGQAQEAHEVDETSGKVQLAAKLTGCIIIGECVVVIVKSFTYSAERDKLVLPGVDVVVIGPVTPHVSRTVDQPGGIQHQSVPQQSRDEVCHPQRLPPKVPRHEHGDEETHEQHRRLVIRSLKHHNFVSHQIFELQLASFLNDIRVFAHQEPANVSKEEAPDGVVRVSICL